MGYTDGIYLKGKIIMKIFNKKFDLFQSVLCFFMLLFSIICFYPFWSILVASFNEGGDYMRGGVYFWPRVFTLNNYITAFNNIEIVHSVGVSFARTLIGTTCSLIFTSIVAYGMSLKDLRFKNVLYNVNLFTMFFGGGLVPYYVLIKHLGLINSFWVYIIPSLYSVYNMIIISNFFRSLPEELHESALADGACEFRIFCSIYFPLSKPVLATVGLWLSVGHWNSYFDAMMYTTKTELQTLQFYLVKLIRQSESMKNMAGVFGTEDDMIIGTSMLTIRYATMMIAIVPVLCVYPFVQKYFTKGIMLGSIKG